MQASQCKSKTAEKLLTDSVYKGSTSEIPPERLAQILDWQCHPDWSELEERLKKSLDHPRVRPWKVEPAPEWLTKLPYFFEALGIISPGERIAARLDRAEKQLYALEEDIQSYEAEIGELTKSTREGLVVRRGLKLHFSQSGPFREQLYADRDELELKIERAREGLEPDLKDEKKLQYFEDLQREYSNLGEDIRMLELELDRTENGIKIVNDQIHELNDTQMIFEKAYSDLRDLHYYLERELADLTVDSQAKRNPPTVVPKATT